MWLRARWYGAGRGGFGTRDPYVGDAETPYSMMYYQYGFGRPISNTDPTGWVIWQNSGSRYHRAIEEVYERTNPRDIHVEFNWLKIRIDLMNSLTGDVYEIEPIYAWQIAQPEASAYVLVLRAAAALGHLNPVYTRRLPPTHYHWNHVPWRLGEPIRFPPLYLTTATAPWLPPYAQLVAFSPAPGVILFWVEPKTNSHLDWQKLWSTDIGKSLLRPHGWQPGMPVPPPPLPPEKQPPQPQPAPPSGPPSLPPLLPGRVPGNPLFGDPLDSGICL